LNTTSQSMRVRPRVGDRTGSRRSVLSMVVPPSYKTRAPAIALESPRSTRGRLFQRRGSQVVMQRSAKTLFAGSIPARASSFAGSRPHRPIRGSRGGQLAMPEVGCDRRQNPPRWTSKSSWRCRWGTPLRAPNRIRPATPTIVMRKAASSTKPVCVGMASRCQPSS
jgi:hypothetical protein